MLRRARVGLFVRHARAFGDLSVWRVIETFGPVSPYVLALNVTHSRREPAGTRKQMIAKRDLQRIPNPAAYLRSYMLRGDLHVTAERAHWG